MLHISAPAHPLIYTFLLQREDFRSAKRLIVETRIQWEKLFQTLTALQALEKKDEIKHYRLITTKMDILEVMYEDDLVGIFPIETLDWQIEDIDWLILTLTKGMKYSEELLVTWFTDHGFKATKSDDEHTFFRQGDTVSIQTRKGTLLVNFFWSTIETIYLDGVEKNEWRFFTVVKN
jgi:hypothetical protein